MTKTTSSNNNGKKDNNNNNSYQHEGETQKREPSAATYRILLVDDDDDILFTFKEGLEEEHDVDKSQLFVDGAKKYRWIHLQTQKKLFLLSRLVFTICYCWI